MSTDEAQVEVLIAAIEKAFAGVPFPGDHELLHSSCYDDNDIKAFYGVTDWRTVSANVIQVEHAALSFFSPEAFQFYLPAFLIWILRNYSTTQAFVVDSTIYSLNPYTGAGLDAFVQSKFALFTCDQRGAVAQFLEHMAGLAGKYCHRDEARRSLAGWRQWEATL